MLAGNRTTSLRNGWEKYPKAAEIIRKTVELRPDPSVDVDRRLIRRRDCEFDLFQSLEMAVELSRIKQGYETMDEFLRHANTVLQRRKARAGLSLELHVRQNPFRGRLDRG